MKTITWILLLLNYSAYSAKINMLNWWNYLSPLTVSNLKKKGFEVELDVYKSNEVAVSKLLSRKGHYDVAIVSNTLLASLDQSELIVRRGFDSKDISRRKYYSFLKDEKLMCLPFLWSASVFILRKNEDTDKISNVFELIKAKEKGLKIGFIDDKFEAIARVTNDSFSKCTSKLDFKDFSKCTSLSQLPKLNFSSSEFYNSVGQVIRKENSAVYGWHGASNEFLEDNGGEAISFILPENRIIISYDMICMLDTNKSDTRKKKVREFIEFLSSEKSIEENVKYSQYFSPFRENKGTGLKGEFRKLFHRLNKRFLKEKPIIIESPALNIHDEINKWWASVRY